MNQHLLANQQRTYSLQDFRKAECMILQCVDWRLHVPLAVDFLQYYQTSFETVDNIPSVSSVSRKETVVSSPHLVLPPAGVPLCVYLPSPSPSVSLVKEDWKSTAQFLVNFSLKGRCNGVISWLFIVCVSLAIFDTVDLNFRGYKQSVVTGGAILAARYYHQVKPMLSKKFEHVSGYTFDALYPCFRHFLQ